MIMLDNRFTASEKPWLRYPLACYSLNVDGSLKIDLNIMEAS